MSTSKSKTTGGRVASVKTQRGWPPKSIIKPGDDMMWHRHGCF